MKTLLRFAVLLLAVVPIGLPKVWAQATFEFASGGGPTGNGPSITNQTVTFRNNTNNPGGTNFTTTNPAVTAQFALSNQQYTLAANKISTQRGIAFGGDISTSLAVTSTELYQTLDSYGGSTNGNYTSASGITGGIAVGTNYGMELFTSVEPLPQNVPANSRYYYGDLTITFSQALNDPVIHVTGMGGNYGGGIGFATELELQTTGVTLSKLSGSNELVVNSNKILNGATVPGATTGQGAASGSVQVATDGGGITTLVFRVYLRPDAAGGEIHTNNVRHTGDAWLISASVRSTPALSGYVFEDVNYSGGAGRPFATAGTVARPNARVELYNGTTGAYIANTTTDASGQYTFNNVAANTTYTVRVVNSTVTSSRALNSGFTAANTSAVQTYNGTTTRVGGQNPALQDAGANTSSTVLGLTSATNIAQSIANVTTTGGLANDGPDFGYNFDLIVNTNDTGQGTLRQFINNANALSNTGLAQTGQTAGVEASIFMIPDGNARPGLLAVTSGGPVSQLNLSGVASITPASVLPALTDANTAIDGTTQTTNINNSNAGTLGTSGTVGTGAATFTAVNRPEVQIVGSSARAIGLDVRSTATNTTIQGISIYGFGNALDSNANGNIVVAANNTTITNSVIGNSATNFSSNPPVATNADNIRITAGTGIQISNNLIGYANGAGVNTAATGLLISNNEISTNGRTINAGWGGVVVDGTNTTISNNYIANQVAVGIDVYGANNTITGNTITNNGSANVVPHGVRLIGAGSTVSQNIINANYGAGILGAAASSNNTFSQNSIYGNGNVGTTPTGQLGIDLVASGGNNLSGNSPFVTTNDNGDADTGGNGLLNYPVISSASLLNGNLVLSGFARTGTLIEFFLAEANPASVNGTGTNFGQGRTYLFSRTEGASGIDLNTGTGSYSGLVNGFDQGSETNQNRFTFSIPLSSLTAAQRTALTTAGVKLTATGTVSGLGTSEFSGNVTVLAAPVAVNDATTTTPGTAVTLTVTTNDQNNIAPATVALNGLTAGSTTAVSVTGGTFQFTSNGQVQFTPAAGFTGVATVPYTVNNTSGATSNTAFITVEVRNPSIDLQASITAPTNNSTVNAGATVTYTVNAINNTNAAVSSVVETLQLPAGLGTVTVNGGGYTNNTTLYNNTTGLVTLTVGTLNANASQSYTVAVSAMPGSGPITATAVISGTGVETNTSNNAVTNTVNINARYDVATTISGPATDVVQGNEVTYTVTTTNRSATPGALSPAPNVVQRVQLPTNLTGVFASNGGTYDAASGVVSFPAIAMLPLGQTVVNSISFAAPTTATFTMPVATVTAGASNDNAGDLNSPSTGTNNNTANLNGLPTGTTVATVAPSSTSVNVYTTISSSASSVAPGASVTLTLNLNNAGPGTATAVTESLLLPTGLTGVTVSNSGSYNTNTGLVSFPSFGSLAPAGSTSATVTFNAPAQGIVLATATIGTSATDLVAADNVAQAKVEVAAVTDLATSLAGPTTVTPGQTVTYTVTTSNVGQSPALGAVQTVSLPTGLSGVTVSGSGSYDSATGLVTFSFSNPLVSGMVQSNSISYTVPNGATSLTAQANVRTTSAETTVSNNIASVATTVQPVADLAVSVSGPTTATVGSTITYTVTTTNNGPSTAANVTPSLQLPANLVGGLVTGGGNYDSNTGVVSFTSATSLLSGSSIVRTVTFIMPDLSSVNGVARATTTTSETQLDNNAGAVATTAVTPGTTTANLNASIATSASTVTAGSPVTLTANFANAAGAGTATNVVPTLALPAGLTGVTVSGGTGGSYNSTTGLVTWNSIGSLSGGTSLPANTYKVTFNAPISGPVAATAFVSSDAPEATSYTDNVSSLSIDITPAANVATSISGPATAVPGSTVTYAVTTLNNGVSAASSTQRVSIPANATNIVIPAGSTQTAPSGGVINIFFPAISNQAPGTGTQITNYVSFSAPSTTFNVSALVTPDFAGGDVPGDNSASTTTVVNSTPIAYNVVNNLQTPQANTAAPLLIAPLVATDADAGTTLSYRITSLPATAAGVLYLGSGTSSPITLNQVLTAAQISTLRFDPVVGFIGNAFFTYTATDNATPSATSNTAIYTIAVGQDANSTYTAAPNKGGSASNYATGDLIGYVSDANSFRYASSGLLYNTATSNGVLVGSSTGVTSASISAADATTLSNVGLTFVQTAGSYGGVTSAVGEIRVTNRNLLRGGSYPITITTVDANGGTNTIAATVVIGFGPLPVTLVEFSAKARNNNDAVLTWATAQEKDNDHFDVERSIDGVNFVKVGQRAGHGNSTTTQQYSFTDEGAARLAGTVYYRLRQVDTDGTPTNSDVRTVAFSKSAKLELTVYPSPATDKLNVRLNGQDEASAVLIFNTAGMRVLEGKLAGSLSTSFEVQQLPAGTYLVQVKAANGQILTSRFVKY